MKGAPLTKPGEHGTLYRYAVVYRDPDAPEFPATTWRCWAYNTDHALEKFYAADDGFEAVSIDRVRAPEVPRV